MHLNEVNGPVLKIRNDPRLHPFGHSCAARVSTSCRTSSTSCAARCRVVGPRPPLPDEVAHYDVIRAAAPERQAGDHVPVADQRPHDVSFEQWMELDNRYIDTGTRWATSRSSCADDTGRHYGGTARIRPTPSPRRRFRLATASLAARRSSSWARPWDRRCSASFVKSINARYYGTQWEMDTFLAAATIPTILFGALQRRARLRARADVLRYLALGGRRGLEPRQHDLQFAWRSCCRSRAVARVLCWRRWYVPLIAHGFPRAADGRRDSDDALADAEHRRDELEPACVAAMLNAYHRFRSAALSGHGDQPGDDRLHRRFQPRHGDLRARARDDAWARSRRCSCSCRPFLSIAKYRPSSILHHPGLQKIWTMLGPIIVGSAAGQLALFFDRFFASTLPPGYMAGMNYATKLVGLPAADLRRRDRDRDLPAACGAVREREPARRARAASLPACGS